MGCQGHVAPRAFWLEETARTPPPWEGREAPGLEPPAQLWSRGVGANLREFRTPGWKRTIPACPKVTETAGTSLLWSRGMAAVRGGTPWPPCVGWQGLGGCCLLRWRGSHHLLKWRGSHHIPAAAETRPAPAGWACGVGAGVAGEPQTSAGGRWRCLARVGA